MGQNHLTEITWLTTLLADSALSQLGADHGMLQTKLLWDIPQKIACASRKGPSARLKPRKAGKKQPGAHDGPPGRGETDEAVGLLSLLAGPNNHRFAFC